MRASGTQYNLIARRFFCRFYRLIKVNLMTPEQRLSAINSLLATGVMRLIVARKIAESNDQPNDNIVNSNNCRVVKTYKDAHK